MSDPVNVGLKELSMAGMFLRVDPVAPKGYEKNWIKTKPGESWLVLPRLYAPLEPILNETWRWNDIERIK